MFIGLIYSDNRLWFHPSVFMHNIGESVEDS